MRSIVLTVVCLLALASIVASNAQGPTQPRSTHYTPKAQHHRGLDTIQVHGFKPKEVTQVIEHPGTNPLLVDVRSAQEFSVSHVAGAINIPLETIEGQLKELHKKYGDRTIITMDETGEKAMQACGILRANKFEWAFYMKGGLRQWRFDQLPLDSASTK